MKRFIPLIAFFIFFIPFKSKAEEIIKKGESLNLERCIAIALKYNPSVVAARNSINVSESRVSQAQANYYPQINATSSYTRYASTPSTTNRLSGTVISDNSFDLYSNSITLSQNIFDFGKTPTQVSIQKFNLDSSSADFENVSAQIILNVKQTYYGVLLAKRNRVIAEETLKQTQDHLEQAKGFFEVGVKPKFDVTKAEVDVSNARLNLIRSENTLRISIVNLNNAMGVAGAPEYTIDDNISLQKYSLTLDDALSRAYENRPDMSSIVAKRLAAEQSVELAKKGYYPALTGNASYNWSGENFPLEEGWNVGATISFPIFSGFSTKYQVDEAKANLNVLKANEESLKQTASLEVQQAYLNLKEAEERIPTAQLAVRQAEENYEIANGRYAAGVGNPIEVTDAELALNNAKTSYIQALYDYKVAEASLEKAMGTK